MIISINWLTQLDATLLLFPRSFPGCFVRIGIGSGPTTRNVYRCCEIVDSVETAKVYNLGKARTNMGLKLRFGKNERVFRLEFVSNSAFSPSEFTNWKTTCEDQQVSLPTKDQVREKHAEIRKAINYEYSSADVDHILKKKASFKKNPTNYAMHKANLLKEKEIAQAEGNVAELNRLEGELNELEQKAGKKGQGTTDVCQAHNNETLLNSLSMSR